MPSSLVRRTSIALLALAAACGDGGGDPNPDGGQALTPDPAYWGLADKRCLVFADKGTERYTMEIRKDTDRKRGVELWEITHKLQGFGARREWLEVKVDTLELHDREMSPPASAAILNRYDPPVVFLKKNLDVGDSVATKTTTDVSGGDTGKRNEEFRVASLGPAQVTAEGAPVEATRVTQSMQNLDNNSAVADKLWFVPMKGFVRYDPQDGTQRLDELELVRSFTIEPGTYCVPE